PSRGQRGRWRLRGSRLPDQPTSERLARVRRRVEMRGSVRHLGAYVRRPAHVILKRLVRSPWVPFEVRARLLWREREHRWVAHRPDTFNGKVRWRMLKDRGPILTTFADKVAAREHVTRLVGTECLTTCHAIVADARELDRARLPREFVAKARHGSGGVCIGSDS